MDFGTTNSGMAVYDGRAVRLLPLDPTNSNPAVARTALYIGNDQSINLGRAALNQYFEENVGRPVKMKKVWVGEVEVYGADMFYVADVYAWVDSLSPGRLFLSIKSGLRDPEYQGTVVGQFYYSLENLIAIYLSVARIRAERLLKRDVRQVVLGRPVRFSTDPEADELAQRRLLDSAFRAGFEKVYLQHEPVAAAYHYAAEVQREQNILVFDFGGGTLDITVMRIGGNQEGKVLATGGIPVAGDIFDQKIVRAKLPRHFGEGSSYGSPGRKLPLPSWIYDIFSDWQRIIELQSPDSRRLLQEISQTASDRQGIQSLISLVTNNYGLQMFDTIEKAKRQLSDDMATVIRLAGPGFDVTELITRSEFEKIIRAEILNIERHLDETITASGLSPGEIDAVVRTGGSSNIPAFRYMLIEKFGRDKVLATDTFSSVTSGLGIIAQGIATGKIAASAHTNLEKMPEQQVSSRPNVTDVNLRLLQRRLETQEQGLATESDRQQQAVVILSAAGNLLVTPFAKSIEKKQPQYQAKINLADDKPAIGRQAVVVTLDESILLATTQYRFFLTTARSLLELDDIELKADRFFQLKDEEQFSAIGLWPKIRTADKLVIVTNRGFARSYGINGLVERVEGPTPVQFDQPLPGVPAAVFGTHKGDWLMVTLNSGRAVRIRVADFPTHGLQVIRRRYDELMAGTLVVQPDDEIVIMTSAGYGRRLGVLAVPESSRPNSSGRVLLSRKPLVTIAKYIPDCELPIITNRKITSISPVDFPARSDHSTRSYQLFKPDRGEQITAIPTKSE
jgi:hypothetical chaperone protein